MVKNEDNIKKRIENCEDLYNRSYVKWNFIKIEDNKKTISLITLLFFQD